MEDDPLLDAIVNGRYQVVRKLGEGGMSLVYEVQHVKLKRQFALKRLLPVLLDNEEAMIRFEREAELLASLRHPNVVDIVDWDYLPDASPFMVLEFLHGAHIRVRLDRAPMSWEAIARVGDQCCAALQLAHRIGITHRDLKPENIFISIDDSGEERVKLLDFGVSKMRGLGRTTGQHALLGTPSYMSPEQAQGMTDFIGPSTDVWAMGTILYEMATQKTAFTGATLMETVVEITQGRPTPMTHYRPDAPPAFIELVDRAVNPDPERRIVTIEELRAGLKAALEPAARGRLATPPAGIAVQVKPTTTRLTPVPGSTVAPPTHASVSPGSTSLNSQTAAAAPKRNFWVIAASATIAVLLALVIILATGCYSPSYENCAITCGESHDCPSGLSCVSGVCQSSSGSCTGGGSDSGTGIDADIRDWKYRKSIGIMSFTSSANITIPIRITNDHDLASLAQPSGGDIRFVTDDNTVLEHEIELYDASSGTLVAWVKVPQLNPTGTILYMMFGNSSATPPDPTSAWDNDYLGVYHFGDFNDSTSGNRDGVATGSIGMSTSCVAGTCKTFTGLPGDNITIGADTALDVPSMTVETWLYANSDVDGQHRILSAPSFFGNRFAVGYTDDSSNPSDVPDAVIASTTSSPGTLASESVATTRKWHYLAAVFENGSINLFVDGVKRSASTLSPVFLSTTATMVTIGGVPDGSARSPSGSLDELRISRVVRPSDYFVTNYALARPDTGAYAIGPLETL